MTKNNEKIKFIVVPHFSGNIPLKDLLKNLIIREVMDTTEKNTCLNWRNNNEAVEI